MNTSDKASDARSREARLVAFVVSISSMDRAYRSTANQAVAHVGLSQAMAWPLVMIGRHGDGLRQGVLAEILGIEGPSLARSVEQLADAGFIERREDPVDRRAKTLHLTPAGIEACDKIEDALGGLRGRLFDGISDESMETALMVIQTLQRRLGCGPLTVLPPRPRSGQSS